jgi:4-alpha-glucanotransferase
MGDSLLDQLAHARGLGDAYYNYRGELKYFSAGTKSAILAAMGCDVASEDAVRHELARHERERWSTLVPPVTIVRGERRTLSVNVPADALDQVLEWAIAPNGPSAHGAQVRAGDLTEIERREVDGRTWTRRTWPLAHGIDIGRYVLRARLGERGPWAEGALIVAPLHCFEPEALQAGERLWGVAVQLYTLRSRDNWGIGDFADLEHVVRSCARHGASFVGLNPLHALFPADPAHFSPYSPSTRHFLNVLYIAVPRIPDYAHCAEVRTSTASAEFRAEIDRLRAAENVDYAGVTALKLSLLRAVYRHFVRTHLSRATPRAEAFRRYRDERGDVLRLHSLHDAIAEHLRAQPDGSRYWGWPAWPEALRDPAGIGVAEFAREHVDEVQFHAWLQWVADEQLQAVQKLAAELGMPIGLYGDYAVGVNPAGSETWSDQRVYRMRAGVGAPPDPLALKGQDWGIPPQDPRSLVTAAYEPFRALIAANMRHFGALRLDHVMALFRQWWVPVGLGATEGGYVHYPLDDLMSVLALESMRRRCLVVGEDLGTVPDEMRRAMPEYAIYHYKVLLFEKVEGGRFRRPEHFERRAIATATTHDLPTLRGYWEGRDLELRDKLDLFPGEEIRRQVYEERARDRLALIEALETTGLKPKAAMQGPDAPFSADFARAIELYLARSTAALVVLQVEDLIGMAEPVNVPGTRDEHSNWQRKVTAAIEEVFEDEATAELLEDVQFARSASV